MKTPDKKRELRENFRHQLWARILSEAARKGIKKRELAEAAGASDETVSNWQRSGTSLPDAAQLKAMAELLQCPPAALVYGDDFEAIDDEERSLVETWRRLTAEQRAAFQMGIMAAAAGQGSQKSRGSRASHQGAASDPASAAEPHRDSAVQHLEILDADALEALQALLLDVIDLRDEAAAQSVERALQLLPKIKRLSDARKRQVSRNDAELVPALVAENGRRAVDSGGLGSLSKGRVIGS